MIESQSGDGKDGGAAGSRAKLLIYDSPSNELFEVNFDASNPAKSKIAQSDIAMNHIFFNQKNSINCSQVESDDKDNQPALCA